MSILTVEHIGAELRSTRVLGRLCLWAGLTGAASGVFLAVVPPSVADDRYSYPLTATGFAAIQGWFVLQHLGLLAGIVGFGRSLGTRGHFGVRVAAAGMLLLTVTELAAIGAARSTDPSRVTGVLDAFYGISSIAIGVGLVVAGAVVLRTKAWRGWRRWVPAVLGAYVFMPMTPLMFAGFLTARLAITGWMLLFALLGWVLVRVDPA